VLIDRDAQVTGPVMAEQLLYHDLRAYGMHKINLVRPINGIASVVETSTDSQGSGSIAILIRPTVLTEEISRFRLSVSDSRDTRREKQTWQQQ